MSEIDKELRIARALLKELKLNLQTAFEVLFAISFTTTFDYPGDNRADTIVVRASTISIIGNSIVFSFPMIEPLPYLDVCSGDDRKGKSGMIHGDRLCIVGIGYLGKGQWDLVGEFESDSPSLDDYYSTSEGTLAVRILRKK